MNSTNLFSPESAAAGQKNQGRARVKIAVFSVLAVHVAGLMALLLTQGCRRETAPENVLQPDAPAADTNTVSPALGLQMCFMPYQAVKEGMPSTPRKADAGATEVSIFRRPLPSCTV